MYRVFERLGIDHTLFIDDRYAEDEPARRVWILVAIDYYSRYVIIYKLLQNLSVSSSYLTL